MRTLLLHLLPAAILIGCTGAAPSPEASADGRVVALTHFVEESRLAVHPRVERIPENALRFHITPAHAQPPKGSVFAIFEIRGEEAYELPDALPKWHWNADFTRVRLEPVGLERGVPYLLAAEGLTGSDGDYAPWALRFRVMPADERAPSGEGLKVLGAPRPGTLEPLTLTFPEPMHEDSVHSLATLVDAAPVPAVWTLSADQRVARFEPTTPWPEGDIRVSIGSNVRDVAGNPITGLKSRLLQPQIVLK